MNCRYRLVFSRSRNMLVAVEETATTAGRSGETRVTGRALGSGIRRSLRRLLPAALLALAPMLTFAQIVAGDAHAPSVIQTPNGLDQVNVNRPSDAGVSVNTYNRFDVQSKGAILNNSPTIVQTQQAGLINGNPNFRPGDAARIIVNQVNGGAASQINGYLEVAGRRAEVVIANGSGISVNGGGNGKRSRTDWKYPTHIAQKSGCIDVQAKTDRNCGACAKWSSAFVVRRSDSEWNRPIRSECARSHSDAERTAASQHQPAVGRGRVDEHVRPVRRAAQRRHSQQLAGDRADAAGGSDQR